MSLEKKRRPSTAPLEEAFGVPFEPELLERALTHRSYAYENGGLPTNERLEFLGDSVLGVVITSALFHNHPDLPEGQLAKLRASVVNMHALADVARTLGPRGLGPHLLLGKGEETTGGRDKASILADTLEALLGAIYLQHGLDVAGEVIHRLFDPLMAESAGRGAALDWKTSLQELTAALGLGVPDYLIDDSGPDHAKTFTAWVVVAGERYGGSEGRSKKQAEQRAAAAAWRTLTERSETAAPPPAVAGGGHADPAELKAAGSNGGRAHLPDGGETPVPGADPRAASRNGGLADSHGVTATGGTGEAADASIGHSEP
jgi:ribonuclease III